MSSSRRLLHEGMVGWKNARGKVAEVQAVVLNDVLLFLQDSNQKLTFFSQDNKVNDDMLCYQQATFMPSPWKFVFGSIGTNYSYKLVYILCNFKKYFLKILPSVTLNRLMCHKKVEFYKYYQITFILLE